jgi:iron complex outermembrane receptor protein
LSGQRLESSEPGGRLSFVKDGNHTIAVPELHVNLGAEWDLPFLNSLTLTDREIHTLS